MVCVWESLAVSVMWGEGIGRKHQNIIIQGGYKIAKKCHVIFERSLTDVPSDIKIGRIWFLDFVFGIG